MIKRILVLLMFVFVVSVSIFFAQQSVKVTAVDNDLNTLLFNQMKAENTNSTYFTMVYVIPGHVPASQGQISAIGKDYFCIKLDHSNECFLKDKVSSVQFYTGK